MTHNTRKFHAASTLCVSKTPGLGIRMTLGAKHDQFSRSMLFNVLRASDVEWPDEVAHRRLLGRQVAFSLSLSEMATSRQCESLATRPFFETWGEAVNTNQGQRSPELHDEATKGNLVY